MKKIILLLLFWGILYPSFAQNIIINKEGDTINCKILKIDADNIYFSINEGGRVLNTLISLDQVVEHNYTKKGHTETIYYKTENKDNRDYQPLRFAINFGYSYLTPRISDEVPSVFVDHLKRLKSGIHFGGDLGYYLGESIGIGCKFSMFNSSSVTEGIYFTDDMGNIILAGTYRNDLRISFFGPTLATRFLDRNKNNQFIVNLSMGYMGYRNETIYVGSSQMTGNTFGMCYEIGYDIGLSKNVMLGFQISYYIGALSQYQMKDGSTSRTIELKQGQREGLNRLDFSIGIRFR